MNDEEPNQHCKRNDTATAGWRKNLLNHQKASKKDFVFICLLAASIASNIGYHSRIL